MRINTYCRNAVTSPGVGARAITQLTRTYTPFSPFCERALWHVAGAFLYISCLLTSKLTIILNGFR